MTIWEWLGLGWHEFVEWTLLLFSVGHWIAMIGGVPWVLTTKNNSTSAVAWCLIIIFLPIAGILMFLLFGWQHVSRPLKKKRRHKEKYRKGGTLTRGMESLKETMSVETATGVAVAEPFPQNLAHLALTYDSFPAAGGNHVNFYYEGDPAMKAMFEAIRSAKRHIHLQTFIFQPDEVGDEFLKALTEKAKQGVRVRLLFDAMGSRKLTNSKLRPLRNAGGKCRAFMQINRLRKRIQVNLRNHRKIMVVDGNVGFCGGMNIGKEYCGRDPGFGYWRDAHFRLEGPAVADLQHVFAEDWSFSSGERIQDSPDVAPERSYFNPVSANGPHTVQVIDSGPDQELKAIREIYFAAILAAKKRLWIASPYFVPDDGLLDALRLAGHRGVDVRLLCLFHPDKWIPLYAARYYWNMMLNAGVKVYQYTRGMMHSKVMMVDGQWASVGSANLDNRSMHLNFEANCLFYSDDAVADLEEQFQKDLADSIRLERTVFQSRPFPAKLLENASRLLSPVL